ncbi:MAG: hypothetical protein RLZ98_1875 [Pseudomonadota bacterium]|jgi:ABC-type amino acid transport substrate-binding protein
MMPVPPSPIRVLLSAWLIALALLAGMAGGHAQEAEARPQAALKVVTKVAPPFAMRTEKGQWGGLAIDLMEEIADELGRNIEWVPAETTADLLAAVEKGQAEAGIAAVTITSERESRIDFSHSYYDTGLGIAVTAAREASFWAGIEALASPAFLGTVAMLAVLLFAAGAIVWWLEHRQNAEQFHKDPLKGIGSGFWWAAVTMTTVGYGDKAPVTPAGRFIAVIWMFAALILTAVFTAQLTSALTLNRLSGPVKSLADLQRTRVGVVNGAASNAYFEQRFIRTTPYIDVEAGLEALADGQIDAFVHDEPILRYTILRDHRGKLDMLGQVFEPQDYGIVLAQGSKLREDVNKALLKVRASRTWSEIRSRYMGGE